MKTFAFTHEWNKELSSMNGKNRRKIENRFLFKTWSWKLGQKFWQWTLFKRKRQIRLLRLTLPSSSVGISFLTITYELWFSSLQDIYFFTALSFYFTKSLFIVQTQGYYNTGWYNPKMRSCVPLSAFWLCMSTNNQHALLNSTFYLTLYWSPFILRK